LQIVDNRHRRARPETISQVANWYRFCTIASHALAWRVPIKTNTLKGQLMKTMLERFSRWARQLETYTVGVKNKGVVVITAFGVAWLCALGLLVYGLYKL